MPPEAGIYTAWIIADEALTDIGVEGPAPVLAYVGKAGNLQERIGRHVPGPELRYRLPFIDLGELLAGRGRSIFNWWARSFDKGPNKYWNVPSALAALSIDQTLAWQRDHLAWGWRVAPKAEIGRLETRAINEHAPLLNRRGQGLRYRPPQLRRVGSFEESRALWLYELSFVAALRASWERDPWGPDEELAVGLDDEGFPVLEEDDPSNEVETLLVPGFDEAALVASMHAAASDGTDELKAALRSPPRRCELLNWWAATRAFGDDAMLSAMLTGRLAPADEPTTRERDEQFLLPRNPRRVEQLVDVIHRGLGYERH